MNSKPRSADWRSILLIIFGLSGALLAITSAIGILVFIAINEGFFLAADVAPLTTILTASTLIAIGLFLLPVTWFSLQRLRGRDFGPLVLPSLRPWEWVTIPSLWILVITLATFYYNAPGAGWYAPILHFLSIALPIYLVVRLSINRISLGSSQRVWGVFGIGLAFSPLLAIIAEITIIALGVLVTAIYLGFNPGIMAEVEDLIRQIESAPDIDSLVYVVGPLLDNPLTLLTALTLLSFFVPIIEETAKSLGVWFVADRLQTPAQGFALGVLSGAGFALAESLSASLSADDAWAVTLGMRAVSGSMHMLATGLFGWGIAYARLEKRYFRLIGMALLAILLHSAWNAGAVFSVAGGVSVMLAMPDFDFIGTLMTVGGAGLLFFLACGMVIAFFVINRRLQTPSPPPPFPAETGEESDTSNELPDVGVR
ncbi:MAG: PrsW family glutamic-type intramembrane protease [Anaerolineales bacterium]